MEYRSGGVSDGRREKCMCREEDRGNSLPALGNRREREVLLAVNYISIVLRY